jgi:hypothetical protein
MAHNKNGLLVVPPGATLQRIHNPRETPTDDASHTRKYGDLFPHPPALDDILQGGIPNCYLLSALGGIINHPLGPEVIERCFLDRSSGGASGEVILRLYDIGLRPQYLQMSKTVARGIGAHHTVWVKLFEKGYAALFGGGDYEGLLPARAKEYGRSVGVYRAVLGNQGAGFNCCRNDAAFYNLMTAARKGQRSNEEALDLVKRRIFNGDDNLLKAWMNWYTLEKCAGWLMLTSTSEMYKQHDWAAFLAGYGEGMPTNVANAVVSYITNQGILPGRRGSGVYTHAQRDVFVRIRAALAANKPVSAETDQGLLSRISKKDGTGYAGESIDRTGLVGPHEYAVLDTREQDGLCWVEVRNPWGHQGVRYERGHHPDDGPKQGRAFLRPRSDTTAGRFWLELADFNKYFLKVEAGTEVK